MQLESTLFGVCVIQIKPQLEKLLKLNDDGLTKEIALTQDLLNLFIEYQIPSDLLSYDGPCVFLQWILCLLTSVFLCFSVCVCNSPYSHCWY